MSNQTLSLYYESRIKDSLVSELMGNGEGQVEAIVLGYYAPSLGAAGAT